MRLTNHADLACSHLECTAMRESTVAASIMIDLMDQLEARGLSRSELCHKMRIDPALFTQPNERVPGSAAERFWRVAEDATGDPLLGLHLAEHYRSSALNIFGYVILNCRSVADAVDRLARFAALLNDGLAVHASEDGALTVLRLEAVTGLDNFLLRSGRHVFETMSAGIVLTLRRLTGRPFLPAQVWFRHPIAGPPDEYNRVFQAPVKFRQREDRLAFRTDLLATPIPVADASLLTLFEGHAIARLDEIHRLGGTSQRVARILASRLDGTVPALPFVASAMAMSGRNLQRTLREEGTTFQALLDDVRREIATAQLRVPGTTAAEVALLLGYSEASAFTRAFRRWTGMTPGMYASQR